MEHFDCHEVSLVRVHVPIDDCHVSEHSHMEYIDLLATFYVVDIVGGKKSHLTCTLKMKIQHKS